VTAIVTATTTTNPSNVVSKTKGPSPANPEAGSFFQALPAPSCLQLLSLSAKDNPRTHGDGGILSGGQLSVGKRGMPSPAFEGSVKSTGLRESQQKCNFPDSKPAFTEVPCGELAPHFRKDLPKTRPFFLKAPVQRSRTHVQPRSDLLKTWFSVTEFSREQATDCIRHRFAFR
jgi:hypothetical protein